MYGALWRHMPGPKWFRAFILLIAALVVVWACFTYLFPWFSTVAGLNEITVEDDGAGASPSVSAPVTPGPWDTAEPLDGPVTENVPPLREDPAVQGDPAQSDQAPPPPPQDTSTPEDESAPQDAPGGHGAPAQE
jgi:hypothetical protein